MTKIATMAGMHEKTIGGVRYVFRTPGLYDAGRMRRRLALEGVRRPAITEYRLASLAGVAAMAEATGEHEEGARQSDIVERWYELLPPVSENDIDIVDPDLRQAELARQEGERKAASARIYPLILAIEANLDRHYPPWRELRADAEYWDEVARIDVVRLLLLSIDDKPLARDADGLVIEASYAAIPEAHRMPLGTFALSLMAPGETAQKN